MRLTFRAWCACCYTQGDLKYLANLCHNCRDCYYACQYAPPHEFDLNVPKALGELRLETYTEFSWPSALKGLFQNNGLLVALLTALSVATVMLLTLLFKGHAVFYGFMLCLASTSIAFFYDHFLNRPAPYPFWSWPVMLGTVGGLALLAGTGGMLYLKKYMDRAPASPEGFGMDIAFTALLFLTSLTGLLVLVFRETAAMGTLLTVHLGFVLGLFLTMPYGKFIHAVYRYAALVRNALEQKRGGA